MKRVIIALADGFEDIEAVAIIDVLRRAELQVTIAGVGKTHIVSAHGLHVEADTVLTDSDLPDALVLPGGLPGSKHLAQSKELNSLIQKMDASKRILGAICAAPALVLAPQGVLNKRKATCYPGFENNFSSQVLFSSDRVVSDGHVITSRGPGTALEFALELVRQLVGSQKANELSRGMLISS